MKKKTKNALVYTRVVSPEITDQKQSIAVQREAIEKYARKKGYTIVGYYDEINASGYRKDYTWLDGIIAATDQKIDCILVYHLDRLTRNYFAITEMIKHLCLKHNVNVRAVTGPEHLFSKKDSHYSRVSTNFIESLLTNNQKATKREVDI